MSHCIRLSLALACILTATSCTTTYKRNGAELTVEETEALELAQEEKPSQVDVEEEKIRAVVEAVGFDRGPTLLRDLHWLVSRKELAVNAILNALPKADLRTKANLLYVLGFSRTPETTKTLVDHMASGDAVVRFEAAAGLLQQGDTTAVPVLVDFLESDDKRLRFKAIQVLREKTGNDFNYRFSAPEEIRTVSVSQWREWWGREKKRLMYRPWKEEIGD